MDETQPKGRRALLTRDQQIAYLRTFGEAWPLKPLAFVCLVITIACIVLFARSTHSPLRVLLLFVAGVSAMLTFAIAAELPGLRRAARATRTGRRVKASIRLVVDRSDRESPVISGQARDGMAVWELQFGKPIGWEPDEGDWACELVWLSDQPTPALVDLEHGVLVPRRASRRRFGTGAQ